MLTKVNSVTLELKLVLPSWGILPLHCCWFKLLIHQKRSEPLSPMRWWGKWHAMVKWRVWIDWVLILVLLCYIQSHHLFPSTGVTLPHFTSQPSCVHRFPEQAAKTDTCDCKYITALPLTLIGEWALWLQFSISICSERLWLRFKH